VWLRKNQSEFHIKLDDLPEISLHHNNIDDLIQADLILVTTKVWQVTNALESIIPRLSPDTIIMLMHNGMGVVDELGEQIAPFPLLIATTTHGAFKSLPTHVLHTGKGTTQIGALNAKGKQCEFISDVFHHALPEVIWNRKIDNALWIKLIINCVVNPLTAIEQCNNGALRNHQFVSIINKLVDEIVAIANAEGFRFKPAWIIEQIDQVLSATAENYSSMHQDIYYQRTTEIDYITGYLLKCAEKHQISAPENNRLYQKIKQMELRTT
jgi:2-dehydropantoate 2-reductase